MCWEDVKIIDFKPVAIEDVGLLVNIYNVSFYSDYKRFGTCPEYGNTNEMMEESIRKYPKHSILCNNKPVGCVSCHSIGLNEYETGCLRIIPEYQGNGIEKRAIKFVQNYYEDWMRMTLITPLDKQENIRFNTDKCGFQIVDTERDGNVELVRFLLESKFFCSIRYDERVCKSICPLC